MLNFTRNAAEVAVWRAMILTLCVSHLFCKHGYVFIERVGGADVASRHSGLSGRAGRQFALLEYQRQERE